MNVLIITPIYYGNAGGAGIYYNLLTKKLSEKYKVKVSIVSEAVKGKNTKFYYGVFPPWAGRDRNLTRDMFYYGLQNLAHFRLIYVIKKIKPNIILIHTSFFNHPGIFKFVFRLLRSSFPKIRFIADARDKMLPGKRISVLNDFDKVIACSKNVYAYLLENNINMDIVNIIPVVQEELDIRDIRKRCPKNKLVYKKHNNRYIIYVGAIKESKAVHILLEAYKSIVRIEYPDVDFLLVGLNKSSAKKMTSLLRVDGVYCTGKLTRECALALMADADLCVNISPNESMSRVSLEAVALKRPCLIPKGIPEFVDECPENVVSSNNVEEVGQQICKLLENKIVPSYPISSHYPENVVSKYMSMFDEINAQ